MRQSVFFLLGERDNHMRMFTRPEDVDAIVKDAVKNAVADATNAVTLAGHMAQCEKDKAELKAEQLRMHNENGVRFSGLERNQESLKKVVYMAVGAAAIVQILLSDKGAEIVHFFGH
jgi:hypothetical protein